MIKDFKINDNEISIEFITNDYICKGRGLKCYRNSFKDVKLVRKEKYNKWLSNINGSLSTYISKYGEEKGTHRYNHICSMKQKAKN